MAFKWPGLWKIVEFGEYRRHATLNRLLPHVPGNARYVLDLGCSNGQATEEIVGLLPGCSVVGIEINRDALDGRSRLGDSKGLYVQGDGLALPFVDGTFDVVMMLEVIEHFDRPNRILGEVNRVLRDGGLVVISTPNRRSIAAITGRPLYAILGRTWNAWDDSHRVLYGPREVGQTLTESGFEVTETSGFWPLPEGFQTLPEFFGRARGVTRFTQTAEDGSLMVDAGFVTINIARKGRPLQSRKGP